MEKTLDSMLVVSLPMEEILSSSKFNIRGMINPSEVVDLAKLIDRIGLMQPITVRPYNEGKYKYMIVAGHRRFEAFLRLERKTIPAMVKYDLTENDALILNFVENIARRDLNILQEAEGIRRFKAAGMSLEETAKAINKGKGWIDIRFKLLTLDPRIQQEAAAGLLTQEQIKDIAAIPVAEKQFAAVRAIKEAKARGDKVLKEKKGKVNPLKNKKRGDYEIRMLVGHILDNFGQSLTTRALAWAAGEVSDVELFMEIKAYADENMIKYEYPEYIAQYMPKVAKAG